MNFLEAIKICLKKYVTFTGNAKRSEFWYWSLFVWLLAMVAFGLDWGLSGEAGPMAGQRVFGNLINLAICLPTIAVSIRRLHDINRSGWWFLLTFTVIGIPVLLFWYTRSGKKYGRR